VKHSWLLTGHGKDDATPAWLTLAGWLAPLQHTYTTIHNTQAGLTAFPMQHSPRHRTVCSGLQRCKGVMPGREGPSETQQRRHPHRRHHLPPADTRSRRHSLRSTRPTSVQTKVMHPDRFNQDFAYSHSDDTWLVAGLRLIWRGLPTVQSPGCAAVRLVVRGEYVIRLLLAHTQSCTRCQPVSLTMHARTMSVIFFRPSSPCVRVRQEPRLDSSFFRSPCGWPLAGACAPPWPHCCLLWWTKALRMRQKEATMQLATVGQPNSINAKVMVWHAPPMALRSRCTPQQLSLTFAPREWIRRCVRGPLVCVAAFLSALHSLCVIISLWES
jgi:hypothetical protein